MPDSMDTANPLPIRPTENTYRVTRKDREKDRQRHFDPLFRDSEQGKGSTKNGDGENEVQDTYEKNDDTEESPKVAPVNKEKDNEDSDELVPGHLVDFKA